jgi:hypothetical protein
VRLLAEGRPELYERIRRPFVAKLQRTARRLARLSRWRRMRGLRNWVLGIASRTRTSIRLAAGYNESEQMWLP